MKKAYVYCVTVDGVARYYGKGTNRRAQSHLAIVFSIARRRAVGEIVETSAFYGALTDAWLAGSIIDTAIIADGLTHRQALNLEAQLIKDAGDQVWNERRPGFMTEKQRKNHLIATRSKSFRKKQGVLLEKKRNKLNAELKRYYATPEGKAMRSRQMKKVWATGDNSKRKANISAAQRKHYADAVPNQVLSLIRDAPGVSHKEICSVLGLTINTVKSAISVLRKRNLVEKRGGYHGGSFYPTNVTELKMANPLLT